MILATFITIFLAADSGMFSTESLVSSIVGGAVAVGVTQWLKNSVQMKGAWAVIISLLISIMTAIVALVVSTFINEKQISYESLPSMAMQVFGLATLAYKLILADGEPTDGEPTATAPVI